MVAINKKKINFAIASLILGIISIFGLIKLITTFGAGVFGYIIILISASSIILGILYLKKIEQNPKLKGKKIAIMGIFLSDVVLLLISSNLLIEPGFMSILAIPIYLFFIILAIAICEIIIYFVTWSELYKKITNEKIYSKALHYRLAIWPIILILFVISVSTSFSDFFSSVLPTFYPVIGIFLVHIILGIIIKTTIESSILILSKLDKNRSRQLGIKIAVISTLIISIPFLLLIGGNYYIVHKSDSNKIEAIEFTSLALNNEDATYCKKITDIEKQELCLTEIAKVKQNEALCNKIISDLRRDICFRSVAIAKKDPLICENRHIFDKNWCLAITKQDETFCEKITRDKEKDYCYRDISIIKKNSIFCQKTSNANQCLKSVAITIKDSSICDFINIESSKNFCLAITKQDTKYCDKIIYNSNDKNICLANVKQDETICEPLESWARIDCFNSVAIAKKDPSICEALTSNFIAWLNCLEKTK